MKEKKIMKKEIFFCGKICFGEALFPPLENAKNQHENFEAKKFAIRRLNVPNFCYL